MSAQAIFLFDATSEGVSRAIAACRRAGFEQEGVTRQAAFIGGRWGDVVMMAALNPREAG